MYFIFIVLLSCLVYLKRRDTKTFPSCTQIIPRSLIGVEKFPNVKAVVKRVNEVQPSNLAEADALAIGSPTYLDYISGELKCLLENTYYKSCKKE